MLASSMILVFAVLLVVATLRIKVDAPHDKCSARRIYGSVRGIQRSISRDGCVCQEKAASLAVSDRKINVR